MEYEADGKKNSQSNQSAEKMLAILEFLADKQQPMRLLDLSRELNINTSTASRFLATLIKCGYAAQDQDTSKYFLTLKLCSLANKISSGSDIRDIANPYMRQVSQIFGESVCLAVEQGKQVVYIDVVEGPDQMIRSMQRIGNAAPLHCTGIGKLFLLDYTEEQIDGLIDSVGLKHFTAHTLITKQQLMEELERVRRNGYAYDYEECELGARCVACPIYGYTGTIIAGISVTGPSGRLTDALIESRLPYLQSTAEKISQKMGAER